MLDSADMAAAVVEITGVERYRFASASSRAGQVVFPGAVPGASLPTPRVPCPRTLLGAFLNPDATTSRIDSVKARIEELAPRARLAYVNQDQSYAEFEQLFSAQPTMVNSVAPGDLPPSFRIVANDTSTAKRLIAGLQNDPAVKHIQASEPASGTDIAGVTGVL